MVKDRIFMMQQFRNIITKLLSLYEKSRHPVWKKQSFSSLFNLSPVIIFTKLDRKAEAEGSCHVLAGLKARNLTNKLSTGFFIRVREMHATQRVLSFKENFQ